MLEFQVLKCHVGVLKCHVGVLKCHVGVLKCHAKICHDVDMGFLQLCIRYCSNKHTHSLAVRSYISNLVLEINLLLYNHDGLTRARPFTVGV
jgi:hypothetical protein